MIASLLLSSLAHALAPADVNPTIAAFNAGSVFDIPELSDSQRDRLLRGDVVRLLHPVEDGNYQVVGLLLVPLPKRQVWIAGQDPHFTSSAAVEKRLTKSGDTAMWYGFLDLPMGFSDRHWVVDVWNNHDLAAASDNKMWEHPWRLRPGGLDMARPYVERGEVGSLTVEQLDGAIFTPYNQGALGFVAVSDEETLLIYHATSAVGGNIPERLMAEFARSTINSFLKKIAKTASDTVTTHYTVSHVVMLGGDGQPVPRY
ncbi:MAG: hypothetical protein ACI8S6_001590 [Myxococcota bacterium]|jgi:hypothetical protein